MLLVEIAVLSAKNRDWHKRSEAKTCLYRLFAARARCQQSESLR